MIKFVRHYPGWVERMDEPPETKEFETEQDMIAHFTKEIGEDKILCWSPCNDKFDYIMEHSKKGNWWWVLGTVEKTTLLPKWKEKLHLEIKE